MTPPIYTFGDVVPIVHPTSYIHPTASLIGDIVIGPHCYVGPQVSLRGDLGSFVMKEGSNIQDGCVVHTFPGKLTELGVNGHVGHGAILHGCSVGDEALIGIGAILLDDSVVGKQAFIGAGSVVTANTRIPPRYMAYGTPAKVIRELTQEELSWKANGTKTYQWLADVSSRLVLETKPASQKDSDRPSLPIPKNKPMTLHDTRGISSE